MPRRILCWAGAALLVLAVFASGCSKSSSSTKPGPGAISSSISSITIGGNAGTLINGAMPTGTTTAPTAAGADSFVAGGAALLSVQVPDSTIGLLVGVAGTSGYFSFPFSAATRLSASYRAEKYRLAALRSRRPRTFRVDSLDTSIIVTPVASSAGMDLQFVAVYAHSHSAVGVHSIHRTSHGVTSGQLQVSLNWSQPVDLDLHLSSDDSLDVYYGDTNPGNGASLDLDSNPGCDIDNIDNENITFGSNVPAHGTYIVRVDLYDACEATGPIPYVVTVKQCGVTKQFFRSVDPASADHGVAFWGVPIDTITFNGCGGASAPARNRWVSSLSRIRAH